VSSGQSERVPDARRQDPEVGLDMVDVQRGIEQDAAFRPPKPAQPERGPDRRRRERDTTQRT
jgi:hypothetical protein